MKLHVRVAVLGAAALAVVALLSAHHHRESAAQLRAQFTDYQHALAQHTSREVESYLQARSSGLVALSARLDAYRGDRVRSSSELKPYIGSIRYGLSLSLLDLPGTTLYSVPTGPTVSESIDEETIRWARAPASHGKVLVLPVSGDTSLEARSAFRVRVLTPVYWGLPAAGRQSDGRDTVSVLSLTVEISQLISTQLATLSTTAIRSDLWVVDDAGTVLFHSRHPEMAMRRMSDAKTGCRPCHDSFRWFERMLNDKQGAMEYRLNGSSARLAAFAPAVAWNARWIVVVDTPLDAITGVVRKDSYYVLLLLTVMAAVLVGGAAALVRSHNKRLVAEEQAREWQLKHRMEERVRESEERYRTIVETAHDIIWILDTEGRLTFANSRASCATGYDVSDYIGKRFGPLIIREDLPTVEDVFRSLSAGEPREYKVGIIAADGRILDLSVNSVPLKEGDRVVGSVNFASDVTEKRRAEEELRETRDFLENLVNHANAPIIVWDPAHRITRFNHAFEVLTGYASDEVIGKTLDFLFPDADRDASLEEIERALSGQRWESVEIPILCKDGAVRIALWSSANLYGRDGVTLVATIAQGQDITDRKRAEEELRRGAQHWQDTFDAIDHTVAIVDRDYTVVKANLAMLREFPGMQVVGERCYRLIHGTDRPPERCQSCKVFGTGIGEHFELLEPHLGGRWFDISAYPVRQENGVVREIVHVCRDITDHKLLEQRFLQAQKMEAVGRLAGGVAHDFNNLLTVIIGYSDFALQSLPPGSALHDDLKEIGQAADRAANLTRQLLAFSRQQVIAPRLVNLGDLALNLDKMLRRLIGEDIQLVILPEPRLWSVKLDPGQFEHVLVNLAVNARDAMPHGGTLTMRVANVAPGPARAPRFPEDADPDRYYVLLEVDDTGEGMTEDVKEHLFEPFFTTKATGKGTGLGLATCYGIVKQNNGLILVDSEPGKGSTFSIFIPRSEEEDPGGPSGEAEAASHSLMGSETVLLAEDEPAVMDLAARVLRECGYTVLEARDGEDALHAARSFGERPIDIVVTDVVMPRLGGWELAERIRASRPDIKVLFMSGHTGDGLLRHGVLESGSSILQKPFTPEALVRRVRDLLDADETFRQGA